MCCIWSLGYRISRLIKFQIKTFRCVLNCISSNKEVLWDSFTLSSQWSGVGAFGSIRPVTWCDTVRATIAQQCRSPRNIIQECDKHLKCLSHTIHLSSRPFKYSSSYCTYIFKKPSVLFCTPHWSSCSFFYYSVVCLTTGPKPLPKRFLHIVRSKTSSFKWEYPLLSLGSSSSFLRLLPRLLVTSISPFIFPSITCFRRQFLRKMWPIQLALYIYVAIIKICVCVRIRYLHKAKE